MVDLVPAVAKGKVFTAMQDPGYFAQHMCVANDRLGIAWPNGGDCSADGLRFMAFPEEEFRSISAAAKPAAISPAA